jgi:predicted RNA-binding protein YlqC (UPF0109 family)
MAESVVAQGDLVGLCRYLVQGLVDEPDAVRVAEEEREGTRVLVVTVAAADRGKVIGKNGRVVRSLRSVIRAGGVKTGERIHVEIEG